MNRNWVTQFYGVTLLEMRRNQFGQSRYWRIITYYKRCKLPTVTTGFECHGVQISCIGVGMSWKTLNIISTKPYGWPSDCPTRSSGTHAYYNCGTGGAPTYLNSLTDIYPLIFMVLELFYRIDLCIDWMWKPKNSCFSWGMTSISRRTLGYTVLWLNAAACRTRTSWRNSLRFLREYNVPYTLQIAGSNN